MLIGQARRLAGWAGLAAPAVLIVGLVVREVFSFWTGHPYDFEIWIRTAYVVNAGHNPYVQFWPPAPSVSIIGLPAFGTLPSAAYPPFWPLTTAGLYRLYLATAGGNRFVLYWMLKQPPIVGDVVAGYLLFRLTERWSGSRSTALAILWFWMIFPYDIIVTAIWGQFDSIPLCLVLGLLWVSTPAERAVLEGVGIFVKWVTVIFLPQELFRNRGWRRLWAVIGGLLPIALTLLCFWAMHWSLTGIEATATSESQGGVGGMNYSRFLTFGTVEGPLSQAVPHLYAVLSYLWVPAVAYVGWWNAQRGALGSPNGELTATVLIVTTFLLARFGLNEQYLLYLFPLLLLDTAAFHPGRARLFTFLWVSCLAFLVLNNTFGYWFLTPLSPQYFYAANTLNEGHNAVAPWFHGLRTVLLNVMAVEITVLLVQVMYVFVKDQDRPRPWVYGWLRWLHAGFARRGARAATATEDRPVAPAEGTR